MFTELFANWLRAEEEVKRLYLEKEELREQLRVVTNERDTLREELEELLSKD